MLHDFLIVLIFLIALVGLISLGFNINPRPFRPYPGPAHPGEPTPFRPGLPEPVGRHFRETIGEKPQQIHSAQIWGRGRACIRGVWVPLRFRAWYRPGESFTRRMEITWFQRPVLRGIDSWMDGEGVFEIGGRIERGAIIDQGQLLTMWADTVWVPSVFVHDPQLQWEPVDAETARLVFPFEAGTDHLLAHFDPLNGRMTHLSALRYSEESSEKEPWRVDMLAWKEFNGMLIPDQIAVAWGESGSPWSYWNVDGIAYNVNVSDQLG